MKTYLSAAEATTWRRLMEDARSVTIMGHASPDGDAMGSSLGLWWCLKQAGKEACVVVPDLYPDFLRWMPGIGDVVIANRAAKRAYHKVTDADLVVCLDFAETKRVEDLSPALEARRGPVIVVDHHTRPVMTPALLVSDPGASSTAEMVYLLLRQLGQTDTLPTEAAQCLYCGMMTDTGAFTYNSTRPEIFLIVAGLLEHGVDKDKIYRNVYMNFSADRMRLEGHILKDKMVYFDDLHASLFTLTREEMKTYNFKKGDAEGFVNLPLNIKGTRLSISLREDTEKPVVRVSLRSVGDFPCNRMAAEFFGGGGHLNASGGTLHMTIDEAVAQAGKAIRAYRDLLTKDDARP